MRTKKLSKKGVVTWRYIVLLVVGIVALLIILYSGIWQKLPIIRELLYWLQNIF